MAAKKIAEHEIKFLLTAKNEAEAVFNSIKSSLPSIKTLAVSAGIALTAMGAAATLGAKESVKAFSGFEDALVDVARVTNQSLESVKDQMLTLPPELGSATDLVRGYYNVISAGVTEPKAALNLLTVAAKAGNAAHLDLKTTVAGLTDIMDGFGDNLDTASEAADKLFTLERIGKVEFQNLIPVIGQVASGANLLNVSIDELGGLFAAVAKTAGGTETAATQVKAIFTSLLKPSESMKEALKAIEFESGALAIKNIGLEETFKRLNEKIQDGTFTVAELFSKQRALLGIGPSLQNNFKLMAGFIDEMADSANVSGEAFERWIGTLSGVWKTFKNTVGKMAIEFGEEMAPDIKEALLDMGGWLRENKDDLVGWAGAYIDGLKSVLKAVEPVGKAVKGLLDLILIPESEAQKNVLTGFEEDFKLNAEKIKQINKDLAESAADPWGRYNKLRSIFNKFGEVDIQNRETLVKLLDKQIGLQKKINILSVDPKISDTVKALSEEKTKALQKETAEKLRADEIDLKSKEATEDAKSLATAVSATKQLEIHAKLIKKTEERRKKSLKEYEKGVLEQGKIAAENLTKRAELIKQFQEDDLNAAKELAQEKILIVEKELETILDLREEARLNALNNQRDILKDETVNIQDKKDLILGLQEEVENINTSIEGAKLDPTQMDDFIQRLQEIAGLSKIFPTEQLDESVNEGLTSLNERIKEFDINELTLEINELKAIEKMETFSENIQSKIDELNKSAIIKINMDPEPTKEKIKEINDELTAVPKQTTVDLLVDNIDALADIATTVAALEAVPNITRRIIISNKQALEAIDEVRDQLDLIPNVTRKKLIIDTRTQGSPQRPFTEGMKYMEGKINNLPDRRDLLIDTRLQNEGRDIDPGLILNPPGGGRVNLDSPGRFGIRPDNRVITQNINISVKIEPAEISANNVDSIVDDIADKIARKLNTGRATDLKSAITRIT